MPLTLYSPRKENGNNRRKYLIVDTDIGMKSSAADMAAIKF